MLRGLPASIVVHAAVFGASYLTLPFWASNTRVYATDFEAVDVNFAEIGEITNIAPLIENEPEEPEEAAPEETEEIPEEPPVEEDLPETEEDVSSVEETPAAAEDPADVLPDFEKDEPDEPEDTQEPEPPVDRRQQPQDDLMNLLNQSETTFKSERESRKEREEAAPPPPEDPPVTALKDAPKPAEDRNRRGAGERNANQARIDAILYGRILPCWDGVSDLPFPDRLNVRMRLELNTNGTIADLRLIEPARRPVGSSPMGTAVDRALRAVRKCAPYNLPQDDYENWRDGTVNLGPAFTPTTQR